MEKIYNMVSGNLFLADINSNGTPTVIYLNSNSYAKFCIEFKDYFRHGCGSSEINTSHVKTKTKDIIGNLFGAPVLKDEKLTLNQLRVVW